MTTEEMLNLIINEIRDIKTDVSSLKSDVSELKAGQTRLEDRMGNLEYRMDKLEVKMDRRFNETAEQVGKVVDALSAEDKKYSEKINELELITKWNTHEIVKMLSRQ